MVDNLKNPFLLLYIFKKPFLPLRQEQNIYPIMNLSIGTSLQGGKYRIERLLGQGGFGITYLGIQTALERRVAIKEFFMKEYCERSESTSHVTLGSQGSRDLVERFREKFLKEARLIANMDCPNIVRIYDIFEENGTAYYVMEYIDGPSLSEKLKVCTTMTEAEALPYIHQIAAALKYIHGKNILHLDVKPGNILLRDDREAVLIDFGISKRYDESGNQTSSTPAGISKGYAPVEQYNQGMQTFTPATDIYSLAATLYKMITGETPPEASTILENGLPEFPASVSSTVRKAIEKGMQPRRKDRPQSVEEFLNLLEEEESVAIADAEDEETTLTGEQSKAQRIAPPPIPPIRPKIQDVKRKNENPKVPSEKTSEEEIRKEEERHKREEQQRQKARLQDLMIKGGIAAIAVVVLIICLWKPMFGSSSTAETIKPTIDSTAVLENVPIVDEKETIATPRINTTCSANSRNNESRQSSAQSAMSEERREPVQTSAPVNHNRENSSEENIEELIIIEDDKNEETNEQTIFTEVDKLPEFPGGQAALLKYLNTNIKYPTIAQENGVQGRVIVQFVVNKDGSIVDAAVSRGVDPYLDKEALRVINSMPKWKPGTLKGKPVRCRYTLPVMFRLQ